MRGTCIIRSPPPPAASRRRSMAHPRFRAGAEVEITSPIHRLRGTLFPGRIVAPSRRKPNSFLVEYRTLVAPSDACRPSRPYREEVPVGLLRPAPPAEAEAGPGPGPGGRGFRLGDAVDAFLNGGWWEGAITKELKNARFMVYFRCVKREYRFDAAELRLHREWVNGNWAPPFEDEGEDGDDDDGDGEEVTSTMGEKSGDVFRIAKGVFTKGALVEVRSDEDGLQGAWFAATIINKVAKNRFFIEYQTLRAEDNSSEYLREQVAASHMRPYPPETFVIDPYERNASVDALYNEGWWEGTVERVLDRMQYRVYFKGTEDRMVCHHSELRLHQDWVNGKWVMPS